MNRLLAPCRIVSLAELACARPVGRPGRAPIGPGARTRSSLRPSGACQNLAVPVSKVPAAKRPKNAVYAQGTVHGRVVLPNGDNAGGLTVSIGRQRVLTDGDGGFALHRIPASHDLLIADPDRRRVTAYAGLTVRQPLKDMTLVRELPVFSPDEPPHHPSAAVGGVEADHVPACSSTGGALRFGDPGPEMLEARISLRAILTATPCAEDDKQGGGHARRWCRWVLADPDRRSNTIEFFRSALPYSDDDCREPRTPQADVMVIGVLVACGGFGPCGAALPPCPFGHCLDDVSLCSVR
jgi:hypothetical protein